MARNQTNAIAAEIFSISLRVYYEDTDAGGVVYYANYLKYMERARSDWLRALGFEQAELAAQKGVVFAVRSAQLEFIKPARLDDMVTVTAVVARRGGASLEFQHEIRRGEEILCRGEIKVACLHARDFVPVPIPEAIADQFDQWRMA